MRIAHFTDIHITAAPREVPLASLLGKRAIGFLNLTLGGRYARFREAPRIVEALVRSLREERPDHILFTGDASSLALDLEFDRARALLEPLAEIAPLTAIPGNHDVYVRSAERRGSFERVFADAFPDAMRSDLGAGPPWVRLLDDELAIVSLRDSRPVAPHDSSGRVGRAQLAALARILDDLHARSRRVILALHYGPRRADGSRDRYFHRLRDDEEFLRVAAAGHVALIVHGHLHDRVMLAKDSFTPVPIAGPGSLTHSGHDRAYHLLDSDAHGLSLTARRYDSIRGEFVVWADAPGAGAIDAR